MIVSEMRAAAATAARSAVPDTVPGTAGWLAEPVARSAAPDALPGAASWLAESGVQHPVTDGRPQSVMDVIDDIVGDMRP